MLCAACIAAFLSQTGQVHPEAGDRPPQALAAGPGHLVVLFSVTLPTEALSVGLTVSRVVCWAAILDVAAFKCKKCSWIPSLKHTLISDH